MEGKEELEGSESNPEEAVNKEEALATVGVTAVGGRGELGLNDSSLSYSG